MRRIQYTCTTDIYILHDMMSSTINMSNKIVVLFVSIGERWTEKKWRRLSRYWLHYGCAPCPEQPTTAPGKYSLINDISRRYWFWWIYQNVTISKTLHRPSIRRRRRRSTMIFVIIALLQVYRVCLESFGNSRFAAVRLQWRHVKLI